MIDSHTKEPIRVSRYAEAWPYIRVPLDQLDLVKTLLDRAGFHYSVDKYAVSVDGETYTAVVNLEHRADVAAIQGLLDDYEDSMAMPHRRQKSGGRG
ncbi:MAG TPA: hypothetical protein VKA15_08985 [Isosphaeraceae bacterium]|nr:hypothetical protein [Isosphaeraceae bacterium]